MIRKSTINDVEAILGIENICFSNDRLSRRAIKYMINHRSNLFFVWESDSEIVGYILVLVNERNKFARIYSLAVLPKHHGKAIARRLILFAQAQTQDKSGIKLEVAEGNIAAFNLYKKLGFEVTGGIKHYYEDQQDAIIMQKKNI